MQKRPFSAAMVSVQQPANRNAVYMYIVAMLCYTGYGQLTK